MQALKREEVIAAFDNRKDLVIPDLGEIEWQTLDYLGWIHPSGHEGTSYCNRPTRVQSVVSG